MRNLGTDVGGFRIDAAATVLDRELEASKRER